MGTVFSFVIGGVSLLRFIQIFIVTILDIEDDSEANGRIREDFGIGGYDNSIADLSEI